MLLSFHVVLIGLAGARALSVRGKLPHGTAVFWQSSHAATLRERERGKERERRGGREVVVGRKIESDFPRCLLLRTAAASRFYLLKFSPLVFLMSLWKKQNTQDTGQCWEMVTCPVVALSAPGGTASQRWQQCRDSPALLGRGYPGSVPRPGQHPRAMAGFRAGHPHGTALGMPPHPLPAVYSHNSPGTGLDGAGSFALHLALAEWDAIRAVKVTADLLPSHVGADTQTLL